MSSSVRVAVVTGGSKGLGLAITRALCKQFEGDVYLTARDPKLGEEAVNRLKQEGLTALFHQLDICDLASIRALRAFMKEKYEGIDVLVNNAGVAFKETDPTPVATQAEVTLRTNYFATRDVCDELLPLVKPQGRVVTISSKVGLGSLAASSLALQKTFRSATITEEELSKLMEKFVEDSKKGMQQKEGWPNTAYGVSEIGVTVLSFIQAREMEKTKKGQGILLNPCCPGLGGSSQPKTPDEGAETPVYLALLPPDAEGPHGRFVSRKDTEEW